MVFQVLLENQPNFVGALFKVASFSQCSYSKFNILWMLLIFKVIFLVYTTVTFKGRLLSLVLVPFTIFGTTLSWFSCSHAGVREYPYKTISLVFRSERSSSFSNHVKSSVFSPGCSVGLFSTASTLF